VTDSASLFDFFTSRSFFFMPSEASDVPSWTPADLLDFDALLADDADADAAGLRARDRTIADEHIAPELPDSLTPDADAAGRARVFRLWLEARREKAGDKNAAALSPGEAFRHSRWLVGGIFGIVSLLAGVGVVMSILHREQRYFNVVLFLAATLLPQLVLLLMLGVGWLMRGRRPEKSAGFFQAISRNAIDALSEKALARKVGDTASRSWRALRRRSYLAWPLAATTQTAAVLFNLGLLAAFVGCLLVMDLRFFWESTPAVEAANSLKGIVDALAAPWSWVLPTFPPTADEIEATRIATVNDYTERADSAAAWAPFLILSLITWGLLPRLLLRLIIGWLGNRAVVRHRFSDRPHRELWRRLTEVRLEAPVSGQRDDAVVLLWGGTDPDSERLRTALLQQARWNPVTTLAVGGLDLEADEKAVSETVEKMRAADRPIRIAVVADSWALVPRDLAPFLKKLRAAVGDEVSILCFLLGAPKGGNDPALVAPEADEISVWENFAADLDDPNLRIQPCKSPADA